MSAPTIGRIVHYTLSESDAKYIGSRRSLALVSGAYANYAEAGQVYPALVVRVFDERMPTANLRVFLDGYDDYWPTSRSEGDGPGYWAWPTIVSAQAELDDEDEES